MTAAGGTRDEEYHACLTPLRRSSALLLEGGAMRGMFTCGVLDVFMENVVGFDAAAGISAGAVFGCNFKSRQIGRAIRYNKRYGRDPRYCSLRSLITTGDLYGADFCYRELPDVLDPFDRAAYRASPTAFYVEAFDILSGRPVCRLCADDGDTDMQWFRASASMPVVSRPVRIDGMALLDGGIWEAVPYHPMKDLGYSRRVLVMTQPKGYRKKKTAPLILMLVRRQRVLAEALASRHLRYNAQMYEIDRDEAHGEILVIRPPEVLGRVGHDPRELERVYRLGREEAQRRLEEIKAYLAS